MRLTSYSEVQMGRGAVVASDNVSRCEEEGRRRFRVTARSFVGGETVEDVYLGAFESLEDALLVSDVYEVLFGRFVCSLTFLSL